MSLSNSKSSLSLHESIKTFDLNLVDQAYQVDSSSINTLDPNIGWTVLYKAIVYEQIEIAKYLLEKGADPNVPNKIGETPLHYASEIGKTEFINLLLKYNASPNIKQSDGNTPLHIACKKNHLNALKIMIQYHAEVNIQNKLGRTPLHFASNNNNIEIYELLLKNKASLEIKDKWGREPKQLEVIPKIEKIEKIEEPLPKKDRIREPNLPIHSQMNQMREITNTEKKRNSQERMQPKEKIQSHQQKENKENIAVSHQIENKENLPRKQVPTSFHRRVEINKTRVVKKKDNQENNEILKENNEGEKVAVLGDRTHLTGNQMTTEIQSQQNSVENNNMRKSDIFKESKKIEWRENEEKDTSSSLKIRNRILSLKAKLNEQPSVGNLHKKSQSQCLPRVDENIQPQKKLIQEIMKKAEEAKPIQEKSPEPEMKRDLPSKYKLLTLSHSKSERCMDHQTDKNHQPSVNNSIEQTSLNFVTPRVDKPLYESLANKAIVSAQNIKHIFTPTSRQSLSAGRLFNSSLKNLFKDSSANKSSIFDDSYECIEFSSDMGMVDWLKLIGLEDLKLNFIDTGYSSYSKFRHDYSHCPTIFKDLLCKFGIDKLGHRCRIIMKLREDSGLFFRTGIFKSEMNSLRKYPSIQEWLRGLGSEEYIENFVDNGFDNIDYILLQTSFKEMPFDEFLIRDELRIDDDMIINAITKRLRQSKRFDYDYYFLTNLL